MAEHSTYPAGYTIDEARQVLLERGWTPEAAENILEHIPESDHLIRRLLQARNRTQTGRREKNETPD